ncbi:GIY-YIG nuclease family protein [Aeromicrobium sp. Root472D3]|uniref:GIY-YIG nuclease family protein n=1 Tax=Aeromicrobium TaxID=2040 RepID=UPI00351011CB
MPGAWRTPSAISGSGLLCADGWWSLRQTRCEDISRGLWWCRPCTFFSHDAVGIETMSHQTFAGHRFNKVNLSREFFRGTPEQALDVLKAHSVEVLGL